MQTVFRQKTQASLWQVCQWKGTQLGYLAEFGPFSKCEEKTKIRAEIDSHGTRDSDASTSPGGGAAGVPLRTPYRRADLRLAAAFGQRTPHILRRSCAVSLHKRALKTARSCYGPDVYCQSHESTKFGRDGLPLHMANSTSSVHDELFWSPLIGH